MHPLLKYIHRRLSKPITVVVSPSCFSFIRDDRAVELETTVILSTGSRKVIGVGQGVSPTEPFEQVALFDGQASTACGHAKFDVLEAFIRYGIAQCSGSSTLLRPVITFRGPETLAFITAGYQEHLLEAAASSAGALECKFERAV